MNNDIRHRGEIYNYKHLLILHDNGVIVFTIRSFSRLVEYYVFQGTILEVNTIDIILIEEQLAIDPGFAIMSPVIIESGATVIADTALTEEDITRHLRIVSTLTGISLGYFINNVNIVHEEQISTNAGVPTVFLAISISNASDRVETVFEEEEISRSMTFTSVFTGMQSGHIANIVILLHQTPLEIYPRVTAEFPVSEARYINAELQTIFMEEDANRDLELITVFTDTRVGYVANNVDVDDGG